MVIHELKMATSCLEELLKLSTFPSNSDLLESKTKAQEYTTLFYRIQTNIINYFSKL